jgi:hypothetical protein
MTLLSCNALYPIGHGSVIPVDNIRHHVKCETAFSAARCHVI